MYCKDWLRNLICLYFQRIFLGIKELELLFFENWMWLNYQIDLLDWSYFTFITLIFFIVRNIICFYIIKSTICFCKRK